MPGPQEHGTITVALLGNPNTGKSTLFNALSGTRERVGNYPGVTVEKKIGAVEIDGRMFALIDLPGTYSLAPRSPDEMVTVDVLLGRQRDVAPPDVVLCIVDASNLERNLYIVSQVLELARPTIIALNMTDVAAEKGVQVDLARLRRQLGVPVVPTQAHRRQGIEELRQALSAAVGVAPTVHPSPFPPTFQQEVDRLEQQLRMAAGAPLPRYLVERLLLDVNGYLQTAHLPGVDAEFADHVTAARQRLAQHGCLIPGVEARARYGWVARILEGVVAHPTEHQISVSDRLDHVLLHKVWGTLIFVGLMFLVFQALFTGARPAMEALDAAIHWLGDRVAAGVPARAVRSLLVDGVFAGVGAVLAFLPQIVTLFFFIAVLEECGYMARAAYLMDKMLYRIGLSGKSFIPLLSSFACAIPGIMATRVIENRRDRLVTILVAPLMSCSARLPVYTLLIAAFVPDRRYLGGWVGLPGLTMVAMYCLGIVTAVAVALVLKRTILHGQAPTFVLELPTYHVPSLRTVLVRIFESGWSFVRYAGTLILAVTVLVWAGAYFPHPAALEQEVRAAARARGASAEEAAQDVAAAYLEQSVLGRAGQLFEPVVRPLGWDWRVGCAVIASFPSREVVISTLGVLYHLGDHQDAASEPLRQTLREARWPGTDRPIFTVPVALSLMVFYALCAQCAATLAVIRRETGSWQWAGFTFAYMTALAYGGAWLTYQIGTRFFS